MFWFDSLKRTLVLVCVCIPSIALGFVDGERHRLYATHQVQGGVVVTGNTLMAQSVVAPQVNAVLLPQSAGDIRDLPFDTELEAAYLFGAGAQRAERTELSI